MTRIVRTSRRSAGAGGARAVVASLGVVVALITLACTSSGSDELVAQSTAPVLVPTDDLYRTTFTVEVVDSPDNYTYRTNWSPSFDQDVDPSLTVVGYQVNDPSQWSGGSEAGDGQAERDAVVAAIIDAEATTDDGPCQPIDPSIELVSCSYDVGGTAGRLDVLVRRFEETSTVMVALFAGRAAEDYLAGDFEMVAIDDAIDEWGD